MQTTYRCVCFFAYNKRGVFHLFFFIVVDSPSVAELDEVQESEAKNEKCKKVTYT